MVPRGVDTSSVQLLGCAGFLFLEGVNMRNRAVCYITTDKRDLLIFRRSDWTRPGVVAGGVEDSESYARAAIRETLEESGLNLQNPVYLGWYQRELEPEFVSPHRLWHQHCFWLEAPPQTPDRWSHEALFEREDGGSEVHHLEFVPN